MDGRLRSYAPLGDIHTREDILVDVTRGFFGGFVPPKKPDIVTLKINDDTGYVNRELWLRTRFFLSVPDVQTEPRSRATGEPRNTGARPVVPQLRISSERGALHCTKSKTLSEWVDLLDTQHTQWILQFITNTLNYPNPNGNDETADDLRFLDFIANFARTYARESSTCVAQRMDCTTNCRDGFFCAGLRKNLGTHCDPCCTPSSNGTSHRRCCPDRCTAPVGEPVLSRCGRLPLSATVPRTAAPQRSHAASHANGRLTVRTFMGRSNGAVDDGQGTCKYTFEISLTMRKSLPTMLGWLDLDARACATLCTFCFFFRRLSTHKITGECGCAAPGG